MGKRASELDRLYREEGPSVWAYLRRQISDHGAAEELFQDTFLVVVKDARGLTAARSPRAWLLGIARNLVREYRRRAARDRTTALTENQPAIAPPAEDPRLEAMRQAMARLPEAQREVLEMRLADGLTYVEIAEALSIPVGTVRSRLHHAVAELRRRVAEISATTRP